MAETHAEFLRRRRAERRAQNAASRAALAAYWADSATAVALERFAAGEFTTVRIADGVRTVEHGPGLDAAGRPLRR